MSQTRGRECGFPVCRETQANAVQHTNIAFPAPAGCRSGVGDLSSCDAVVGLSTVSELFAVRCHGGAEERVEGSNQGVNSRWESCVRCRDDGFRHRPLDALAVSTSTAAEHLSDAKWPRADTGQNSHRSVPALRIFLGMLLSYDVYPPLFSPPCQRQQRQEL